MHATAAYITNDNIHNQMHPKMESAVEKCGKLSIGENPAMDDNEDLKKTSVRFAEKVSTVVGRVPTRESLSKEEIQETWWSSTEYHGIRLAAKFLTKEVRKRDKSVVAGIEEAYARALHLACTLSDDDYELMMENCQSNALCLKEWCSRGISARGLERYTSQKHRFERTEFAEETRAAVLRLAGNESVSADQLSVFYREYARSAAIYARFCGDADEHVSKNDYREVPSPPCRPVRSPPSTDRAGKIMVRQLSSDLSSVCIR